jgi:hypothetical protein
MKGDHASYRPTNKRKRSTISLCATSRQRYQLDGRRLSEEGLVNGEWIEMQSLALGVARRTAHYARHRRDKWLYHHQLRRDPR